MGRGFSAGILRNFGKIIFHIRVRELKKSSDKYNKNG